MSVQLSCSVMSNSLWLHGLQHARPPCPSPTPGAWSNSCPSSQYCHPTISSSVVPSSSCLQSFPALQYFPVSQLFASGGQIIGVSASTSVLPMNIQDWFPLGWTSFISLLSRDSQESSPTPQFKSINSLALSFLYSPTLTSIHDYWKTSNHIQWRNLLTIYNNLPSSDKVKVKQKHIIGFEARFLTHPNHYSLKSQSSTASWKRAFFK